MLAKQNKPELILLVALGSVAKVQEKLSEGWDPNVRNQDGITPALKATERNDMGMLEKLIAAGAILDVADMGGCTPLKYAQIHKNAEMIKLIQSTIALQASQKKLKDVPVDGKGLKKL